MLQCRSLHWAALLVGRHAGRRMANRLLLNSSPDGHWDIFVVGANGGKPRRLTNQPSFESVPCWSRDGKWIYFCSDRSGTYQIWKMPLQGGEAMQVTNRGGFAAFESPDGKFLYYTKSEEGKEGLWRMPAAGGEEVKVIDSTIVNRAFSVIDDGIYFITGTRVLHSSIPEFGHSSIYDAR